MPYKNFSSFKNVTLAFGNPEEDLNYGFTALPVEPCETYADFDDVFFLLYRRSEYAAQIELACSKIFKMLMGYGPDMEIVQEGEKFYIASRGIKNFKVGYSDFSDERQYAHINGLAATRVIYYFICGTDNHSENHGMQKSDLSEKAFRIDMPEAFDLEMLNQKLQLSSLQQMPYIVEEHFEGDNPMFLPQRYVMSAQFQKEKMDIIQKIATTPFSQFEKILRDTLTVDHYSHLKVSMQLMINQLDFDDAQIEEMEADFSRIKPESNSLETMIALFKSRHETWHQLVAENPVMIQDLTLADPIKFMAELNKYHSSSDSSESERDDEPTNAFEDQPTSHSPSGFFTHRSASVLVVGDNVPSTRYRSYSI